MPFTFVRDPIETFVAGWLEVMCRKGKYSAAERPGASLGWMERVPNASAAGAFAQFLRDVAARWYLGHEAEHIWPQAHKVDALPDGCTYEFIGKTATMDTLLRTLIPGAHLPPKEHGAEESRCKAALMETFAYGDAETRALCEFLRVDYTCFDFELPAACSPRRRGG